MCFNLVLLWQLHLKEDIIRNGFIYLFPSANIYTIIFALVVTLTVLSVLGMLTEGSKIFRLEMRGFEPKQNKFEKLMEEH
jgi:hypothetical protein